MVKVGGGGDKVVFGSEEDKVMGSGRFEFAAEAVERFR